MSNTRELDLIIWGATGFTGRLVVEYLMTHHPNTRLAVGGRNEAKCKEVLSELGVDLPIIIADAFDEPSLRDLVRVRPDAPRVLRVLIRLRPLVGTARLPTQ